MTKFEYQGTPASDRDIGVFENKIGAKLPEAYSAFLAGINGGQPKPNRLKVIWGNQSWASYFEAVTVNVLYGLRDDDGLNLEEELDDMEDRLPRDAIPIGSDPGGSLFLLFLKGPCTGQIHIWVRDCEVNFEQGEIPDMSNVGFIAEDFAKFLDYLDRP